VVEEVDLKIQSKVTMVVPVVGIVMDLLLFQVERRAKETQVVVMAMMLQIENPQVVVGQERQEGFHMEV